MRHMWSVAAVIAGLLAGICLPAEAEEGRAVPVIYSTDLYHPHIDLDDHFDLAQLFALAELDIKGIILDINGKVERSGQPAVEQMMAMTGRSVALAVGLKTPLRGLDDRAMDQPGEFQKGVELVLRVLKESDEAVAIITTGSVRDIVAAYNREGEMFRRKVSGIHMNIGSAGVGGEEYNVGLDVVAYRAMVQSGLPVFLYPCFPADGKLATYWRLDWKPIFEDGGFRRELRNYFVYAMEGVDPGKEAAASILRPGFRPESRGRGQNPKEIWCTPSLLEVAGRKVYAVGPNKWIASRTVPAGGVEQAVWSLAPARIELDERGRPTKVEIGAASANVRVFGRSDPKLYEQVMRSCLLDLYRGFPMARR